MAWASTSSVAHILAANHYLGSIAKGVAWHDQFGVIVIGQPTSRNIPTGWVELSRWCILSREKNAGSQQWRAFSQALRKMRPDLTTVVSYSDPKAGHTGALYRACNWLWAPTWHRIRPPPSGGGSWDGRIVQAAKDRWIFPLRKDSIRERVLLLNDESLLRRYPSLIYKEPVGVPFKAHAEILALVDNP